MLFLWADCPEKLTYAWVRRLYKICFLTLRLVNDSFSFFDFFLFVFRFFIDIRLFKSIHITHSINELSLSISFLSLSLSLFFFFLQHCQFRRIKYFLSYYLCFFFFCIFFMCKDSSHKLARFIEHYCILCCDRHQVIVLFSMAVFVNNNNYTPSFLSHSYVSKIKVSLVALITWRQTLDTD